MTDQHVKESLLAYIVLLTSATGDPRASLPTPSRRCTDHLNRLWWLTDYACC